MRADQLISSLPLYVLPLFLNHFPFHPTHSQHHYIQLSFLLVTHSMNSASPLPELHLITAIPCYYSLIFAIECHSPFVSHSISVFPLITYFLIFPESLLFLIIFSQSSYLPSATSTLHHSLQTPPPPSLAIFALLSHFHKLTHPTFFTF